jgi:mono/diheme cytochrome c family protein
MMKAVTLGLVLCAAALPVLAQAPAGDTANGAKLFKRYCAGCHGADGRGGAQTFMPHIENLTKKGYIDQVPDDYLYGVIAEGGVSVGKSSYMPAWGKTLVEQDIRDIIAHIRSLPIY